MISVQGKFLCNNITEGSTFFRYNRDTKFEKEEQGALRRRYIDSFKRSLVSQLDNTYVVEPNGEKRKLQRNENKGD